MLVHSTSGRLPRRGPKRPTALAVRKQHVEGQESERGYPCSVTCPSPKFVYSLSLIDPTESRLFRIASNGSVSTRNVSEVFEAAASSEIDNSSGPPSCRDKLQYWVLEWWRGSCRNVPSRLLDVIEYEMNREYCPQGEESHWQCDPRSFSFLPFKALVRVSANRGLEWQRTDESRQGMPNLPQISAGTSAPRGAGKRRRSPKRKISRLGGSTLWIKNVFSPSLQPCGRCGSKIITVTRSGTLVSCGQQLGRRATAIWDCSPGPPGLTYDVKTMGRLERGGMRFGKGMGWF